MNDLKSCVKKITKKTFFILILYRFTLNLRIINNLEEKLLIIKDY